MARDTPSQGGEQGVESSAGEMALHSNLEANPATSLESSTVISLVRKLLGPRTGPAPTELTEEKGSVSEAGGDGEASKPAACAGTDGMQPGQATGRETDALLEAHLQADVAAQEQEAAAESLWDAAHGEELAHIMVHTSCILDVICTILEAQVGTVDRQGQGAAPTHPPGTAIISGGRTRLLECCLGILANIVCHASLSPVVAEHTALLDLITCQALWLAEAPPLIELCRTASVALRNPGHERWLQRLANTPACAQLLWVVTNTLDPQLHARALDLIVALLHAEQQEQQQDQEAGPPSTGPATAALLENGLLGVLYTVLHMAAQGRSTRTSPELGWGRTPSASLTHQYGGMNGATPGPIAPSDVELTDDAVDAALRALEELVASPACLPAVSAHPGLTDVLLGLLHADSSSQVIESLLLILLDLRQASVPRLASGDIVSLHKLLDALGELSASQQQLREAPMYLVALSLRHIQQQLQQQQQESPPEGQTSTTARQPSSAPASQGAEGQTGSSTPAEASAAGLPLQPVQVQPLCELAQRIASLLSFTETLTADAVRYARAAAASLVALLEGEAAYKSRPGGTSTTGGDGDAASKKQSKSRSAGGGDDHTGAGEAHGSGQRGGQGVDRRGTAAAPCGKQQENAELHAIRRALESLHKVLAA